MHRKEIKGILHNFLGTYTSRYSDYGGYWLFGMMIEKMDNLQIDLLNPKEDQVDSLPISFAVQLAALKFREQIDKAGFPISFVREARLEITKSPSPTDVVQGGPIRTGNNMRFVASAVLDNNKRHESEVSIFVAPHNPKTESCSTRKAKKSLLDTVKSLLP